MKLITHSLRKNDQGNEVKNLHYILFFLVQKLNNPNLNLFFNEDGFQHDYKTEVFKQFYGSATAKLVNFLQELFHGRDIEPGVVDNPTALKLNELLTEFDGLEIDKPENYPFETSFDRPDPSDFIVTGNVEFEDGTPAAGFLVSVFDRDIGANKVMLGDPAKPVLTSDKGIFPPVHYRRNGFSKGEGLRGLNANLVFAVHPSQGRIAPAISAVYRQTKILETTIENKVPDLIIGFEADNTESVRIVLAGRPSERGLAEYQRLLNALTPLMINGTTPADFNQERFHDLDFAAKETGWASTLIKTMQASWLLAQSASREPQSMAETFYGLLREGPPTEVASLSETLDELLEQDLRWQSKLEDSLLHRIIDGKLDTHLELLRNLHTEDSLRAGNGRRASIGDVLAQAGISENDQMKLVSLYQSKKVTIEEFWRDLVPQQLGWKDKKIREVQTALEFADLLAYDLPLIRELNQRGFKEPVELMKLDTADWTGLIREVGVSPDATGDTEEEKISRTVNSITDVLAASYPNETIARLVLHSPDPKLRSAGNLLKKFFQRESSANGEQVFDIRVTAVTTYFETHGERIFQRMRNDDRDLLKSQLQRLQRVFRLSGKPAQIETLMEQKLDSAFHITRFSPEHFAEEFGERLGGVEQAKEIYGRAEQIAGTILYLHNDMWKGIHDVSPMTMKSARYHEKIPAIKELPEYQDLFGSLQLCDCCHCNSFYGPAAYFVDLLHMLERPTLSPNPVETLFQRRPDLAHIQLTCKNTNTLIPYVDLVTEVLESFVAHRAPHAFNIPPAPPHQKLPAPSAEELRVNPIYITADSLTSADHAYLTLQESVFPLTLPLNLPLETTRIYLEHLGTSRAELMTLLDHDPGLEVAIAKACEILLLSPEEFDIIAASKFNGASSLRPKTMEEVFGLTLAPSPAKLFNHAAPEFFLNPAAPDPRKTLIRSLQNILSLVSPPAIPEKERGHFDLKTEASVNAFLTKNGLPANGHTDDLFWSALAGNGMPSLSVLLCPVPFFLDRSGLTYPELVDLVKTRFVNPTLQGEGDFDYLTRLGIPAADVRNWIVAGIPVTIPAPILNQLTALGENPVFFTTWVKRRSRAIVINTGFEAPCDLDRATLMHLDGTLLLPDELYRLFQFIRLWKKLEWSLADMDLAVEPGSLDGVTIFETVLLLANVKQLHVNTTTPIEEIVCWWQPIPTHGELSLYDRLFRNKAAQLIDPILELNPERTELKAAETSTPPTITDHISSLLAAFRLSAQDMAIVRNEIGLDDDFSVAPAIQPLLNITTLSAIYRQVSLARALELTVRESISLIRLTGLKVFERPDRFPQGELLRFVVILEKLRTAGGHHYRAGLFMP
jgi:hypothetical protein